MESQEAFAIALRKIRKAKSRSQEDFDEISRTYISALERGLKSPTLRKVEVIAEALGVHPLTLLLASYSEGRTEEEVSELVRACQRELQELLDARDD